MIFLIILLWASAVWLSFGALASIAMVGKPRKPITSGIAIWVVITTVLIVFGLVAAALALT